jgi:predicted AAA+ superfamily ATPase
VVQEDVVNPQFLNNTRIILLKNSIAEQQIMYYDFNDILLSSMSNLELYNDIINKSINDKVNYLLLNEIQEIKNFERIIISLFELKKLFVYYFLYDNYTKNSMLTTFYIIYL